MAERIVSPGVFTQERDLSFLIPGIQGIGGAFIGPTNKGPAFVPTVVNSGNDFVQKFGEADENSYVPATVKNYLNEAASAVVVRVLGLTGYAGSGSKSANLYVSGSGGKKLFAVLHPSTLGQTLGAPLIAGTTASFNISITGNSATNSGSGLSLLDTSTSYVVDYFGKTPDTTKEAYMYSLFRRSTN